MDKSFYTESIDPVGDLKAQKYAGIIQKYKYRVLLIMTDRCFINCPFCFRKFSDLKPVALSDLKSFFLNQTESKSPLHEVIFSGGEPLLTEDIKIKEVISFLSKHTSVKILRVHSRYPAYGYKGPVNNILETISRFSGRKVFVIHINHPDEFHQELSKKVRRLKSYGFDVLSQSVLLKGINDNVLVLKQLFEMSFNAGILPYYLHQLDRAPQTGQWMVSPETGVHLIRQLRSELPGYMIPRYVKEISGMPNKMPLDL